MTSTDKFNLARETLVWSIQKTIDAFINISMRIDKHLSDISICLSDCLSATYQRLKIFYSETD